MNHGWPTVSSYPGKSFHPKEMEQLRYHVHSAVVEPQLDPSEVPE